MNEQEIIAILKPLVTSKIYKDEVSALRNIIFEYARKKEDYYNKINSAFEKKYRHTFDECNEKMKNSSAIEEESWMDWKSAIEMGKAWNFVMKQINED